MKIIDLYLTLEKESANESEEYTDVVVTLENGEKYIASFFAYGSIEKLNKKHRKTGTFLFGKYFRAEQMVLIEDCTKKNIKEVVQHLLDENDFNCVFKLITTKASGQNPRDINPDVF